MEVTNETLRQMIIEVLGDLSSHLENSSGTPRGAELVTDLDTIKNVLSLPGVKYDDNPVTNDAAKATVYVQIPYSILSDALAAMKQATSQATTAAGSVDDAVQSAEDAAALANTAASSANTAASNADTAREQIVTNEQTRQSNELTRQTNEATRSSNEQTRQANEQARTSQEALRVTAEGTRSSNEDTRRQNEQTRVSQEQERQTNEQTRQQQEQERQTNTATAISNAETATEEAEKVNCELDGMTVTVTNRNGIAQSVNIGFEVYRTYASVVAMNADAENVLNGKFVMIATTDTTSEENARLYVKNSSGGFTFLSDLDQASSSAWADWLNNKKPEIDARIATADQDHAQAATDHATATTDHTQAQGDHSTAEGDHSTAATDHVTADTDHTRAEGDHTTATTDHSTATQDHTIADNDHTQAESDHSRAETDHTTAGDDHSTAGTDHTRAETDHSTADSDHTRAGDDHDESVTQSQYAKKQGDYAKNMADHPAYIADGTDGDANYWYTWDYAEQAYVKDAYAKGDDLHYDEMNQQEKEELAQTVLEALVFDSTPTANSVNPVTSQGIKSYVDNMVSTATADFRGTFLTQEAMDAVTADRNDYCYLVTTDEAGNTIFNRYKWVEAQGETTAHWVFEFSLNNPSFTTTEWAAIQSGITTAHVQKVTALPTAEELTVALAGKQDAITFEDTATATEKWSSFSYE